jgi:zinc transporter ZupT
MIIAGWSSKKILLAQMLSVLGALVGLYIGILLSQIAGATSWILISVAGMFLYIALAEVVRVLLLLHSLAEFRCNFLPVAVKRSKSIILWTFARKL